MDKQKTAAFTMWIALFLNAFAAAQAPFKGSAIVPAEPTSTDSITYIRLEPRQYCQRTVPTHTVMMRNNDITITFGAWAAVQIGRAHV